MSEDYRKGYKDGFDDGYERGRKDAQLHPTFPIPDIWGQPKMQYEPRCPVCGMRWDKPMGYVCMNDKCPSKATCGVIGEAQTNNPNLVPVSDTDTGC